MSLLHRVTSISDVFSAAISSIASLPVIRDEFPRFCQLFPDFLSPCPHSGYYATNCNPRDSICNDKKPLNTVFKVCLQLQSKFLSLFQSLANATQLFA